MPSPALPPAKLRQFADCACFNARWFSRIVTQHYERRLKATGLRPTQLPILARLASGPEKMAALGDWLALERTALLRTVRPLLAKGYLVSEPATEGRGVQLALTSAGHRFLAEIQPAWAEAQAEVVKAFGGSRWADFMAAMEAAAARLAKE